MKVALVYDRINKWGGAERVLLALQKMFPDAPLYTSVYNKKTAPWAKTFSLRTSFLQKLPFASSSHEFFPLLMPIAFEQFQFDEYDLVISVTSEAAKGIITKPHTKHICYCLTPTRYLWSGYDSYFQNPFMKVISKPAVSYLRSWDKIVASRPDTFIAISHEVQKRIATYYNRESKIIYPPLMIENSSHKEGEKKDFYLVVSRLVPYKRIELAIEACNQLKLPLIIIGVGSERKRLEQIAGPTITFKGALTDEELVIYYKQCRALIFPGVEDFGLVMAEAQFFGKPVIAFNEGGALDIIQEGKTGIFFGSPTVRSLSHALEKIQKDSFSEDVIRTNAERFSFKTFKLLFMSEVEQSLHNS